MIIQKTGLKFNRKGPINGVENIMAAAPLNALVRSLQM